jgi:hypothetical protein
MEIKLGNHERDIIKGLLKKEIENTENQEISQQEKVRKEKMERIYRKLGGHRDNL